MESHWPSFAGRRHESAEEFLEALDAGLILAGITDERQTRLVRRVRFREGLKDEAKIWLRTELSEDAKQTWEDTVKAFKQRFPEPSASTEDSAPLAEALTFKRQTGEPLKRYLKRAEKLCRRLRKDEYRLILASNLLTNMTDGEVDSRIKERVEDRLAVQNKLHIGSRGEQTLSQSCSFRDVYTTILACSGSYGSGTADSDEEDSDDEDDRGYLRRKDMQKLVRAFGEMAISSLAPFQPNHAQPTQGQDNRDTYDRNSYNRGQSSQNANRTLYNPDQPRRPMRPQDFICDNCGESGHIKPNCPHPEASRATQQFNRSKRMTLQEERERERAEKRGTPATAATTTTPQAGREGVSALFASPWQNEQQMRTVLMEMTQREVNAMTRVADNSSTRDRMRTTTEPAGIVKRKPKDKHVTFDKMPETWTQLMSEADTGKGAESTGIRLSDDIDMTESWPAHSRAPRVEEVSDSDDESENTARRKLIERIRNIQAQQEIAQGNSALDPGTSAPQTGHTSQDSPQQEEVQDHEAEQRRKLEDIVARQKARDRENSTRRTSSSKDDQGKEFVPPDLTQKDQATIEKFLKDIQEGFQAKKKPPSHISAIGKYDLDPFDIGDALSKVVLEINALQLLDAAPRLRADLNRLISSETHGARGKPKKTTGTISTIQATSATHADSAYQDVALSQTDVGYTGVGYVSGHVNGVYSPRLMLDDGATLDCISPGFAQKLKLETRDMVIPWTISLANNSKDVITQYVVVDVVVGGILTVMTAFVYGEESSFDLLLSQAWYLRVQATQDWKSMTITVRGRNGHTETLPVEPVSALSHILEITQFHDIVKRDEDLNSENHDQQKDNLQLGPKEETIKTLTTLLSFADILEKYSPTEGPAKIKA